VRFLRAGQWELVHRESRMTDMVVLAMKQTQVRSPPSECSARR
jgi:hypothetical protein